MPQDPSASAIIPPAFLARMQRLMSAAEYADFLACYTRPISTGLRVNTLKISPQAFRRLAPFDLQELPWMEAGFLVQGESQPGKHPYHAAGLYYLQEPSAMAVAGLLAPRPGERVLDLSAAPGGKATHLAALMENQGLLVANEIHPRRAWELAENLERCGVRIAAITQESPEKLANRLGLFFDRVLVDAPCSGEGMFRKSAAARQEWSPALVEACAARQGLILDEAARLVRPGGVLAYSTCTFAPEEDEGVILRFLEKHPEFELSDPPRFAGFDPGRPEWSAPAADLPLERTVRLWPHRAVGEGHFIAVLQRSGVLHEMEYSLRKPDAPSRPVVRTYLDFCRHNLSQTADAQGLFLEGSYLYRLSPYLPDLKGLKIIHPGWWLGTAKISGGGGPGRFEPSHALALGLQASDARRTLQLEPDSDEALRYLHGESLPDAGEDGWVLVCVNGYPLGWGKRVQGRLKNKNPHGLRWNG